MLSRAPGRKASQNDEAKLGEGTRDHIGGERGTFGAVGTGKDQASSQAPCPFSPHYECPREGPGWPPSPIRCVTSEPAERERLVLVEELRVPARLKTSRGGWAQMLRSTP